MVIIDNKLGEITAKFPKNSHNFNKDLTLLLKSELTLKSYRFDNLQDVGKFNEFYEIKLDLRDVEDGEYIYTLFNDKIQNIGLLRLGKIDKTVNTEYKHKEEITEYKY